jgi:hypothetical protein
MSAIKSSRRPISIKKEQNNLGPVDKCAKLLPGFTEPNRIQFKLKLIIFFN